MKWNNVSEKEPDHFVPVLVKLGGGSVCVATWDESCNRFVQDTSQSELYGAEPLGRLAEQPKEWAYYPWREEE